MAETSGRIKIWHNLNFFAYVFMVIMNYLSVAIPFGGLNPEGVSEKYSTLIMPSNITFSIWALIYGLLAIYAFYSFFVGNSKLVNNEILDMVAVAFFLSCIFNSFWLVAFQYEKLWLSLILMLGLLSSLIYISGKADINFFTRLDFSKAVIFIPISIYLGWVSVATILNVATFLVSLGFSGGTLAVPLSIAVLLVAGLLSFLAVYLKNNFLFSSAVTWALFGIFSRASENLLKYGQQNYGPVRTVSFAVFLASLCFSLFGAIRFAVASMRK